MGFPPVSLISLPIATPLRRAVEVMCGQEGVDWTPAPGRDLPDTCPNGLYDPVARLSYTVQQFVPGSGFQGFSAFFAGSVRFFGTNFDLDPYSGLLENPAIGSAGVPGWRPSDLGAQASCGCPDSDGDGTDDCTETLIGSDPMDPGRRGPDHDRDGLPDDEDPCPGVFDPTAADSDGDGLGDPCDPCPLGDPACEDPDGDGIPRHFDICPSVANPFQEDFDWDGLGDECDACPSLFDFVLPVPDADADGVGDACNCNPSDGGAWSAPTRVAGLRLSHVVFAPGIDWTGLVWQDLSGLHGPGTVYDLARGTLESLSREGWLAGASCHRTAWPDADFLERDEGSFWYLVRPRNSCAVGRWAAPGRSSSLDDSDPCP